MNVQQTGVAPAKTPHAPPVDTGVWIGVFVAAMVGIFWLAFTTLVGWSWLKADNAAAWLQAVGSVAGIGLAVAVPAWQHRKMVQREAERQRHECRRLLEITLELMRNALDVIQMACKPHPDITPEDVPNYQAEIVRAARGLIGELGGVPLQAFPSARSASAVMAMRSNLGSLTKVMSGPPNQAVPGLPVLWFNPQGMAMLLHTAKEHCAILESELGLYL